MTSLKNEYAGDQNIYILAILIVKSIQSFAMLGVGVGIFLQLPVLENSRLVTSAKKIAIGRFLLYANMIRFAFYLNWIGIALVGLEIILRNWVLDDEVQKWCAKSVFGKGTSYTDKFKTLVQEEEAFNKAIVSI